MAHIRVCCCVARYCNSAFADSADRFRAEKNCEVLKLYQDATDQNIKHFFNKINGDYYICELVFNNLINFFESNKTDFIQMIKDGVISLVNKEDLEFLLTISKNSFCKREL